MSTKTLTDWVDEYREKFGEPPPIWEMDPDDVVQQIRQAIEDGEPIGGAGDDPDDERIY